MKNLFLIAIIAIFSLSACAQEGKEVPAKVTSAFSQKFPDAKKVSWDRENSHEWEAVFKMNGKEYSANFNNNGKWIETEYEIKKSMIPAPVKATLDKEFAGYDIEEAEISETGDGKVFEFQIEKGDKDMEVAITPNGKVLKKEEAKDEDRENGENDEDDED